MSGLKRLKEALLAERFYIMASVTGGVTGSRQGPVKDKYGSVMYFDDEAAADKEAARGLQPPGAIENRAPDIRNPQMRGIMCKQVKEA